MDESQQVLERPKLSEQDKQLLELVQDRILWLSTRMIDYANRERENLDGL